MWKTRRRVVLLFGGATTLLIPFLDDPAIAVPSRARVAGRVAVRGGNGMPEEVRFTAAGRGSRLVRKAAFP